VLLAMQTVNVWEELRVSAVITINVLQIAAMRRLASASLSSEQDLVMMEIAVL